MNSPLDDGDLLVVEDMWDGDWHGPSVLRVEDGSVVWAGPAADAVGTAARRLGGVVLPGFTDSHVHLELSDPAALVAGGIADVLDLGAAPATVAGWAAAARSRPAELPGVRFAGAFLTVPGGYPAGRSWAPHGSVRELRTSEEARDAVRSMHESGASVVKATLNAAAGPTLSDELLGSIVAEAHARSLPVVAHTEGPRQAMRAAACGVDLLAHTPWTETLTDDEIALLAERTAWISTLGIQADGSLERRTAIDNLRRFAVAGGRVLYGTDLGNGDLPVGVSASELAALFDAGLDLDAVLGALSGLRPPAEPRERVSWIPAPVPHHDAPADTAGLIRWLTSASILAITPTREPLR